MKIKTFVKKYGFSQTEMVGQRSSKIFQLPAVHENEYLLVIDVLSSTAPAASK